MIMTTFFMVRLCMSQLLTDLSLHRIPVHVVAYKCVLSIELLSRTTQNHAKPHQKVVSIVPYQAQTRDIV